MSFRDGQHGELLSYHLSWQLDTSIISLTFLTVYCSIGKPWTFKLQCNRSTIKLYWHNLIRFKTLWPLQVNLLGQKIQKSIILPIEKYTVRMVSEMILTYNCQLRWLDKASCCPPLKDNVTVRVYSYMYFIMNYCVLICYDNMSGIIEFVFEMHLDHKIWNIVYLIKLW